MRASRSRTLQAIACLAFTALAVRPVEPLERALDVLLSPTRSLSELASPIGRLQVAEPRGEDPGRVALAAQERAEHGELERALLASALPRAVDPEAGVRAVHAEVVGRPGDRLDTLRVRVRDLRGVRVGLPVVSGDAFVGMVQSLSSFDASDGRDLVEVQLITARDARIGAVLTGAGAADGSRLVVGALAPARERQLLDVHNPERHGVTSGLVLVHELDDTDAGLADGFVLGELETAPTDDGRGEERLAGVRPWLDYREGLYQVLILTDDADAGRRVSARESVLDDGLWEPARLFLRGEAAPGRAGRKLARGSRGGVRVGAAVASGARLFGRIERAGLFAADVRLVDDPGFSVPALALHRVGDEWEPHVLGRIVSRGRDASGALVFDWRANLPFIGDADTRARVWTGAGEAGVPRGLLIGDTVLPSGPGPHRLVVTQPPGAREPATLRVRRFEEGPR